MNKQRSGPFERVVQWLPAVCSLWRPAASAKQGSSEPVERCVRSTFAFSCDAFPCSPFFSAQGQRALAANDALHSSSPSNSNGTRTEETTARLWASETLQKAADGEQCRDGKRRRTSMWVRTYKGCEDE